MDKVKAYLASIGSRGGKAGTGQSKRRDQDDPDYYKRISEKAAKARKAKKVKYSSPVLCIHCGRDPFALPFQECTSWETGHQITEGDPEMMDLEYFDKTRPCSKCGGFADAKLDREFGPVPELMVRKCLQCGHRWSELPLDAKRTADRNSGSKS